MTWSMKQIFQDVAGRRSSFGTLLIGMILGLSGGLFWGHLNNLLLQGWESLQIQKLMSQPSLLCFLSAFICMSIDSVSSAAGALLGVLFFVRIGNFIEMSNAIQARNIFGLVCLIAVSAIAAFLGTVFFSHPLFWGVLSVPLSLLASTFAFVSLTIVCLPFYSICSLFKQSSNSATDFIKYYVDISLLMYVTLFVNAVTFMAFGNIGHFIKISALVNILLPLYSQLVPSGSRTPESSSSQAVTLCVCAAFWGLVVLSALTQGAPHLELGTSTGAAMGVVGAFRVTMIYGASIPEDGKDERLGLTVGATLGAFVAFYFY